MKLGHQLAETPGSFLILYSSEFNLSITPRSQSSLEIAFSPKIEDVHLVSEKWHKPLSYHYKMEAKKQNSSHVSQSPDPNGMSISILLYW